MRCIDEPAVRGRVVEVGGPEVMSYASMLERTAAVLGQHRAQLPVPLLTPRLSALWVRLVTGMPRALVAPLVESLRHPMVVDDDELQRLLGAPQRRFEDALHEALSGRGRASRASRRGQRALRRASRVRSVQRLPLPPGRDATWVAAEYPSWLMAKLGVMLVVEPGPGPLDCRFFLRGSGRALLELRHAPQRSEPDRAVFDVHDGLLVDDLEGRGRLEFRLTPERDAVLAAVHDFRPSLPWWIYEHSQARVHLAVMHGFGRHLARIRDAGGRSLQAAEADSPPREGELGG